MESSKMESSKIYSIFDIVEKGVKSPENPRIELLWLSAIRRVAMNLTS
jgi:hypothetical protein